MKGAISVARRCLGVALATLAIVSAFAPAAGAADWLPAFGLGAVQVSDVDMTPRGDIAVILNTSGGPALRFRPAGGKLSRILRPFPTGADGANAEMDAKGNTYMVWRRAGALETRVRRRDGTLTTIQTLQAGVSSGVVAVAAGGRAVFAWIGSDAGRAGAARTRDTDGTLGPVKAVTLSGEKTRNLEAGVAADGDATFVWTTPDAPPNTKVKARTLDFATQALSGVLDISTPPSPELSDISRVVVDPAGDATFVWRHLTTAASLVETRTLRASGTLGPTQTLTGLGATGQSHDIAMNAAGNARIVWVEHAAGTMDPYVPMTCITAVSSSCGAFTPLSTSQALGASVAMGPAGDALAGWASPTPGQVRVLKGGGGFGVVPDMTLSPTAALPLLAVDGAGNGIAVWRDDTAVGKAAGFDAVPPEIRGVSLPAVVERGVRMRASAGIFDVWGAKVRWRFGDGGKARGRSVRHTFRRTGSFRVEVTATDGAGESVSAVRRVRVRDTRPG